MLHLGRTVLSGFQHISCLSTRRRCSYFVIKDLLYLACLADYDIVPVNYRARTDDAVDVQFIVSADPPALRPSRIRPLKEFIFFLSVGVSPKEGGSEQSSVNARLVEHD
jgi:hypothetical protein